ncbi:MAG: DinB family protein [Candidatus Eiseniibacteriota bacterium]
MSDRTDLERLADEVRCSHHGDAWHGSAVEELLADVDHETAALRSIPDAHTIWELALHIRSWRREVARRLAIRKSGTPDEGDYPPTPEGNAATAEAWERDRASLTAATQELIDAIRKFAIDELDRPLDPKRDPALGTGVITRVMIHGVAQHDAYHGGQIALLKKAAAARATKAGRS